MSLTPKEFKKYTDEVLEMGAKKYGEDTWKRGEHFSSLANKQSAIRHILQSMNFEEQIINVIMGMLTYYSANKDTRGFIRDTESGLYHLQHTMTRCGLELYMIEHKLGEWAE